ncbi:Mur ligase domain-containing protein [Serinicoccus sp. CUA-874]|uniref:Mur ligase domain-containing protein n=1 Tax=Serinicoccus sp. CUA-874 TaxID=1517939 RepID=UPI001EDC0074|nr:Mur ligase domain-containing protein [Serinicoccus sp. CUA-874]
MRLSDLAATLGADHRAGRGGPDDRDSDGHGDRAVDRPSDRDLGDIEVTGVSHQADWIRPGDAFVAVRGARFDGHTFIADASRAVRWPSSARVCPRAPPARCPTCASRRCDRRWPMPPRRSPVAPATR